MKISEVIQKLQSMPDHDVELIVAVKTATQRYPQAYVTPFQVEPASTRIYISLPDGMYIGARKA